MLFKLAWRNIWRNKRRSLITIASIFFAVFFSVLMRTIQLGMYGKMIANVVEDYMGYLQIHAKGYWDDKTLENTFAADSTLRKQIEATPDVLEVVPRLEGFALAAHGDFTKAAQVTGINPDREATMTKLDAAVTKGKMIGPDDKSVLLSEGLAEYFKLNVGDTLYLLGQGYHATSAAGRYTVKGLVHLRSPEMNKMQVFLPIKEAQWFFNAPHRLTAYAVDLPQDASADEVKASLVQKVDTSRYELKTWRQMMPEMVQAIQLDNAGGLLMVLILYLIIGFGMFGTILMMTAERRVEFGVLVAVGMKRLQLARTVFMEILMLAFSGVVLGLAVAWPLIFYLNVHPITIQGEAAKAIIDYGFEPIFPTSLDPTIPLSQAGIVFLIAFLLSFYPLYAILRMKAVEAMRG